MAAQALTAAMPPSLDLPDGYLVVWDAIDATGASVANVVVTNVSLFGATLGAATTQPNLVTGDPILLRQAS